MIVYSRSSNRLLWTTSSLKNGTLVPLLLAFSKSLWCLWGNRTASAGAVTPAGLLFPAAGRTLGMCQRCWECSCVPAAFWCPKTGGGGHGEPPRPSDEGERVDGESPPLSDELFLL